MVKVESNARSFADTATKSVCFKQSLFLRRNWVNSTHDLDYRKFDLGAGRLEFHLSRRNEFVEQFLEGKHLWGFEFLGFSQVIEPADKKVNILLIMFVR